MLVTKEGKLRNDLNFSELTAHEVLKMLRAARNELVPAKERIDTASSTDLLDQIHVKFVTENLNDIDAMAELIEKSDVDSRFYVDKGRFNPFYNELGVYVWGRVVKLTYDWDGENVLVTKSDEDVYIHLLAYEDYSKSMIVKDDISYNTAVAACKAAGFPVELKYL